MARTQLKLTGNWKKLRAALDADRFDSDLQKHVGAATTKNALMVAKEMRKRIQQKRYTANAVLTIAIKRSSKPLVDHGDLFQAIGHQKIDWKSAFVGVNRTAKSSDGQNLADVALIVHEGASIRVTAKMRNFFNLLAEAARNRKVRAQLSGRAKTVADQMKGKLKEIKGLSPKTTAILIPPRRFMKEVLEDPKVLEKCRATWQRAVNSALAGKEVTSTGAGKKPGARKAKSAPTKRARGRDSSGRFTKG